MRTRGKAGALHAKKPDLISMIEAAYAVELETAPWLDGIVKAARSVFDRGKGTLGHVYRVNDEGRIAAHTWSATGVSEGALRDFQAGVSMMPPAYVERTFKSLLTATMTDIGGVESQAFAHSMSPFGVKDAIGVNGFNPGVGGVWVGSLLPSHRALSRTEAFMSARVARHLAAAMRLRHRLAGETDPEAPEAIFDPDGRLQHAEGEAKPDAAREALRLAVTAFDRARGPLRRSAPDEAVTSWRVLVQSRWSLLDHFERGGRRYVVAQVNQLVRPSPTTLTPRERQVLTCLGLGYSTKLIAYELGISDTTVRVLLSKAASKLGLRSRKALRAWAVRLLAKS